MFSRNATRPPTTIATKRATCYALQQAVSSSLRSTPMGASAIIAAGRRQEQFGTTTNATMTLHATTAAGGARVCCSCTACSTITTRRWWTTMSDSFREVHRMRLLVEGRKNFNGGTTSCGGRNLSAMSVVGSDKRRRGSCQADQDGEGWRMGRLEHKRGWTTTRVATTPAAMRGERLLSPPNYTGQTSGRRFFSSSKGGPEGRSGNGGGARTTAGSSVKATTSATNSRGKKLVMRENNNDDDTNSVVGDEDVLVWTSVRARQISSLAPLPLLSSSSSSASDTSTATTSTSLKEAMEACEDLLTLTSHPTFESSLSQNRKRNTLEVATLHAAFLTVSTWCVSSMEQFSSASASSSIPNEAGAALQTLLDLASRAESLSLPLHRPLYNRIACAIASYHDCNYYDSSAFGSILDTNDNDGDNGSGISNNMTLSTTSLTSSSSSSPVSSLILNLSTSVRNALHPSKSLDGSFFARPLRALVQRGLYRDAIEVIQGMSVLHEEIANVDVGTAMELLTILSQKLVVDVASDDDGDDDDDDQEKTGADNDRVGRNRDLDTDVADLILHLQGPVLDYLKEANAKADEMKRPLGGEAFTSALAERRRGEGKEEEEVFGVDNNNMDDAIATLSDIATRLAAFVAAADGEEEEDGATDYDEDGDDSDDFGSDDEICDNDMEDDDDDDDMDGVVADAFDLSKFARVIEAIPQEEPTGRGGTHPRHRVGKSLPSSANLPSSTRLPTAADGVEEAGITVVTGDNNATSAHSLIGITGKTSRHKSSDANDDLDISLSSPTDPPPSLTSPTATNASRNSGSFNSTGSMMDRMHDSMARDMVYLRDSSSWMLPDVTEQLVKWNMGRDVMFTRDYEEQIIRDMTEEEMGRYDDDDEDYDDYDVGSLS